MQLREFLLVGLGGAIGSMLRYGVGLLIKSFLIVPAGTFMVNMIGSFLIGLISGMAANDPKFQQNWYIFLATGLCGGFTTFSALSWEGLQLLQQQRIPLYLFYVMSSILGGLLFVGLGMKMAR